MTLYTTRPELSARRSLVHSDSSVTVVTKHVYAVDSNGQTVGFIEEAGPVFVALSGQLYCWAVEIGQTRSFEDCVEMLSGRS